MGWPLDCSVGRCQNTYVRFLCSKDPVSTSRNNEYRGVRCTRRTTVNKEKNEFGMFQLCLVGSLVTRTSPKRSVGSLGFESLKLRKCYPVFVCIYLRRGPSMIDIIWPVIYLDGRRGLFFFSRKKIPTNDLSIKIFLSDLVFEGHEDKRSTRLYTLGTFWQKVVIGEEKRCGIIENYIKGYTYRWD